MFKDIFQSLLDENPHVQECLYRVVGSRSLDEAEAKLRDATDHDLENLRQRAVELGFIPWSQSVAGAQQFGAAE